MVSFHTIITSSTLLKLSFIMVFDPQSASGQRLWMDKKERMNRIEQRSEREGKRKKEEKREREREL